VMSQDAEPACVDPSWKGVPESKSSSSGTAQGSSSWMSGSRDDQSQSSTGRSGSSHYVFEETMDYQTADTLRPTATSDRIATDPSPRLSRLLIAVGVLGSLLVAALVTLVVVLLTMG
jgi:hypothetical protein